MPVGIGDDRSAPPWRVFWRRDQGSWIFSKSVNCGIEGGDAEADSRAKSRWSTLRERIELKYTTSQFGGEVLRAVPVLMSGELQSELCVERCCPIHIGGAKDHEI